MSSVSRSLLASAGLLAVAAFTTTLSGTALGQDAGKTVWDGVYSAGQSTRGEAVSKSTCVSCHGEDLAGGDLGPALQGPDFRAVWSGKTAAELYDKVHTTMPADRIGSLKPEQSADLVAYIFKLNEYPSGAAELSVDTKALALIRIRSQK